MRLILSTIIVLVLLYHVHVQPCKAGRVLHEERELKMNIVLQSLQRGPVPPSGPSGCTNIPGSSGPNCPLN